MAAPRPQLAEKITAREIENTVPPCPVSMG
jgi:hypothetical protein